MFTGIITHQGKVISLSKKKNIKEISIKSDIPLKRVPIGSSIAVDGACFTIFKKKGKTFSVQVMEETLNKTIASTYNKKSTVNLELPLKLGDRLDGHFTLGHVDFTGTVLSKMKHKASITIEISSPSEFLKYFTKKGSVCCNGTSLTITDVSKKSFSVDLIPHTLKNTNLKQLTEDDKLNIEVDTLARYIESLLKKPQ